jgi:hypothetical protein
MFPFEDWDKISFVPDMIAGCHYVDTERHDLVEQFFRHTETGRGIFAIGDDEVYRTEPRAKRGQIFAQRVPSGFSADIPGE